MAAKQRAFFGESLRGSRVGGFRLSERVYPPRFRTPKHAHKWPLLCLVLEGAFAETCRERTQVCKAPMLLFRTQGEAHAERFHENGARLFVVEMDPRWFRRIKEQAGMESTMPALSGGIVTALGRRLYKEFLLGDNASHLVVEGLVLEIFGEAVRNPGDAATGYVPRWLQKAHEMLTARFAEPLTLDEVAQEVGVHPVHLAQMFRKHFRCTVGAHVRRLRIDFACRELANSDAPLVDIALAAGFCDQSHFTKTFRHYTGLVPSQFRNSLR